MGLIRKSFHVATVGAVAPNSKKQRVAKQQLAALQGKTPAQVRRAGGRYEHSVGSVFSGSSTSSPAVRAVRPRATQAPSETTEQAQARAAEAGASKAQAEAAKAQAEAAKAQAEASKAQAEASKAQVEAEAQANKAQRNAERRTAVKASWSKFRTDRRRT